MAAAALPARSSSASSISSRGGGDDEEAATSERPLSIVILSGGMRGDVQPATALAAALAARGHHVRLAADASLRGLVERACAGLSAGSVQFFPFDGVDAHAMMALTVKWGGMLPTSLADSRWLRGQIWATMGGVLAAAVAPWPLPKKRASASDAEGNAADAAATSTTTNNNNTATTPVELRTPDLLVANQLAYGAASVAEALRVPLHAIYTIPWLPTSDLAHPWARAYGANVSDAAAAAARWALAPLAWLERRLPGGGGTTGALRAAALRRVRRAGNRASGLILEHTAWWGMADLTLALRARLRLPLLSANSYTAFALHFVPAACLWSPTLVPKPADWGDDVTVAGFLELPGAHEMEVGGSDDGDGDDDVEEEDDEDGGVVLLVSSQQQQRRIAPAGSDDVDGAPAANGNGGSGRRPPKPVAASKSRPPPFSSSYQPPQRLLDFLASSPAPPLFIGFGSLVVDEAAAADLLALIERAVVAADERAVVATGWLPATQCVNGGGGGGEEAAAAAAANARLCFISEAPHEWLFPRVAAVVHHGGVGTTAAGLRAARPTAILPAFGDLFLWGDVCPRLGVGPPPVPLPRLAADALAGVLRALRADRSYAERALEVSCSLRAERGVAVDTAVASVLATAARAKAAAGGGRRRRPTQRQTRMMRRLRRAPRCTEHTSFCIVCVACQRWLLLLK